MKPKDDLGELVKEWRERAAKAASTGFSSTARNSTLRECARELREALEVKVVVDREDLEKLHEGSGSGFSRAVATQKFVDKYLPKESANG